jgi:hypothetical protein
VKPKTFAECVALQKRRKDERIKSMKKLLLVLAILAITAPAFAEVKIYCDQQPYAHFAAPRDGNVVTVYYDATSEANNVRAFGLEIELVDTAGVDNAVITGVEGYHVGENDAVNKGHGIFPGTIVIDGTGTVTDDGTPVAPSTDPGAAGTGLGTKKIVVEMGSLYTGANSPAKSGVLLKFRVNNKIADVKISENAERGGVVMENPDEVVDFNAPGNGQAMFSIECPGDNCGLGYGPKDGKVNTWDYLNLTKVGNWLGNPPADIRVDICGLAYGAPDGKANTWDYLATTQSAIWLSNWQ